MQWLMNEFKDFREEIRKSVADAIEKWALGEAQHAKRFEKLEGEIKAMKARAGKQKD